MKADERKIDRSRLRDIKDVVIDTTKPCQERIQSFVNQIGNPYCYLDKGIIVEVAYADTDVSLQDRLSAYASCIDQTTGK